MILDLPYDHWLLIAFAYDDHVDEMKKIRARRSSRTRR